MSHYEVSEKINLVFDIGSSYTKFGFAGEFSPRCIIPSVVTKESDGTVRKLIDYKDEDDLYSMLVDFLHHIYFKHALTNPKDRTMIVVESLLNPTLFRETLAKVMFSHFEVAQILWLPSHLVSLSTLAVETALVMDVGYKEAVLIPVCQGTAALQAWQALPTAAEAIHNVIRSQVKLDYNIDLSEKTVEDIKIRACFVTKLERAQQYENNTPPKPCPGVEYLLEGSRKIVVLGKIRETACEVLFERDNDFQSISTMILDALLKCPIDLRKTLADNILLIGGTVMSLGFKARLKQELYKLLNCKPYSKKLHIKTFKFHSAPAKENYTAWLGGAIYGCTDIPSTRSLSRDAYLVNKRVPDWSNLIDNKRIIK